MEILLRNKFSSVGMLLGVIALLLSLVQFTFGPFSTKSTALEIVVAEKVSAVKKGIIAGIKGEQPGVSGALFFSGATLAFHAALLAFGLIVAVLLLLLVISVVSGSTLF